MYRNAIEEQVLLGLAIHPIASNSPTSNLQHSQLEGNLRPKRSQLGEITYG